MFLFHERGRGQVGRVDTDLISASPGPLLAFDGNAVYASVEAVPETAPAEWQVAACRGWAGPTTSAWSR